MIIIRDLTKMIKEEIRSAEKYAKNAMSYKESDIELADIFYRLSTENISRVGVLHDCIVRIINEYKQHRGEPPKEMMAIYNYVHEEEVELVKEIRLLLEMFKTN